MTEALGDHLGVHADLEQLRRVCVAQVMEADLETLPLLEPPPDAVVLTSNLPERGRQRFVADILRLRVMTAHGSAARPPAVLPVW